MRPRSVRPGLALAVLVGMAAHAQTPPAPDIDPNAPLPPIDAAGVDWPDMSGAQGTTAADAKADGEVRYRLDVQGLDDVGLEARFRALSSLEKSGTAENVAQLDRRAREDVTTIDTLLRAAGYYAGRTDTAIQAGEGADKRTVVTLTVEPGPQYTFSRIDVTTPPGSPRELILDTLGLFPKEPVDAQVVLNGEARLRTDLPNKGYPFVVVGDRDIALDHDAQTAAYTVPVAAGARSRFGAIRLEDRTLMGPRHVARLARFKPGELYDQRDIEDLRRALVATGLFSSVTLRPEPTGAGSGDDQIVDIAVVTQRAPPRTISTQAGYGTGEGIRTEVSWQNRALIRPEGALTARAVAGTQEQRLAGELRFHNFRRRDDILLLNAEASHEDRAAYQAKTFQLGGSLARETNLLWQKVWTYSIGGQLIATDETDTDLNKNLSRSRTFLIAAAPLQLGYDGSDDLLDPKRGVRLSGRLSPEISFQNRVFGYTRAQIDASAYQPFARDRYVLAGRVRVGSIFGASRDSIAPSRRFYAGGGGSVRGYGYQDIGPRDAFDDPIGGRSLAEAAVELRARFGDFGIVPFVDGGQIYTTTLPKFDSFRIGTGVGVRYYTSFGPIRVDVGTPLGRRSGEPRVTVYVALGQAF